jgi:hypothetical protein
MPPLQDEAPAEGARPAARLLPKLPSATLRGGVKGLMQMVLAQEINSVKLQPMIQAEVDRYLNRFVFDATTKPKLWHSEPADRAPLRVVRDESRDDDPTAA